MCAFFYSTPSTLKNTSNVLTIKVKRGSNVHHALLQPSTSTVSIVTSNGYMVRGRKHVSVRSVGTSPTLGVALRGIKNHTWVWKKEKSTNIILVLVNSLTWGNLKKHVKVEHDKVVLPVKTFECYDCIYTATRTTTLKLHKKSIHQKRLTMSPYWRLSTILVFVASNTKCDFCTRER